MLPVEDEDEYSGRVRPRIMVNLEQRMKVMGEVLVRGWWLFVLMGVAALCTPGCALEGDESLLTSIEAADVGGVSYTECEVSATETEIDYNSQIKPLFEGCVGCHTNLQGFDITVMPGSIPDGAVAGGPLIIACKPLESPFFAKISGGCADLIPYGVGKMPAAGGMTVEQSALIQQWIAEGAQPTFTAGTCP